MTSPVHEPAEPGEPPAWPEADGDGDGDPAGTAGRHGKTGDAGRLRNPAQPELDEPGADEDPRHRPRHLRWWKEVLYVVAFYAVYSLIRNQFGSAAVSEETAFGNARLVIDAERAIGTYHEETIQEWFLGWRWFIQAWNIFYGTFHFVVTVVALVLLYRRWPHRYIRWRTTLAATTALALIGFAAFPLMPPRLLPSHYGFVDTLAAYGGLWSFDSEAVKSVSNQYAAMPSLHFGWSAWSAAVLLPGLRRRWAKALAAAYPAATLFAIIVTGNHYWIDAAGGAAVLGLGYLIGRWWDGRVEGRRERRDGDGPGSPSQAGAGSVEAVPHG